MNKREDENLDSLLEELPDSLDDELLFEINPWHRPIMLIIWGILLTSITLNFLYLQYILPALGMALMYIGFRSLRRENGALKAAWVMAAVRCAAFLLLSALEPYIESGAQVYLTVFMVLITVSQLVVLRSGLRQVFEKTGAEPNTSSISWLIFANIMIIVLALINQNGELGALGWLLMICYIVIIVSLRKLAKSLGETGYAFRIAPVRLGDIPTVIVYIAVFFMSVLICTFFACHKVPAAVAWQEPAWTELREELAELGFPEDILSCIPEDELTNLTGAVKVSWNTENMSFDRHDTAEGDGTNIRMDTVYIEIPEKTVYVVQYFEWLSGGAYWGDGFNIWTDSNSDDIRLVGGELLYEKNGIEYVSEIPELSCGLTTKSSMFFGSSTSNMILGEVCFPFGAERQRGYVMYSGKYSLIGLAVGCGNLDYFHRSSPFILPYQDPIEHLLSGSYDYHDRIQNYTTYNLYGEYYDLLERG
ncbi:MAG: hypothetical protein ACI3VB_08390 [Oscillospiraceae bacterium]